MNTKLTEQDCTYLLFLLDAEWESYAASCFLESLPLTVAARLPEEAICGMDTKI